MVAACNTENHHTLLLKLKMNLQKENFEVQVICLLPNRHSFVEMGCEKNGDIYFHKAQWLPCWSHELTCIPNQLPCCLSTQMTTQKSIEFEDLSMQQMISSSFVCSTRLRGSIIGCGCATDAVQEFLIQPWCRRQLTDFFHRGIFNVQQRMLANRTSV